MMRTQVTLTVEGRRLLDAEAVWTGRSTSPLIRDAAPRACSSVGNADADSRVIDASLGAWGERGIDGEANVTNLRSGSRMGEASWR